jgi:hypothetical protein
MVSTSTALPARLVAMQARCSTMDLLGSCKWGDTLRMHAYVAVVHLLMLSKISFSRYSAAGGRWRCTDVFNG